MIPAFYGFQLAESRLKLLLHSVALLSAAWQSFRLVDNGCFLIVLTDPIKIIKIQGVTICNFKVVYDEQHFGVTFAHPLHIELWSAHLHIIFAKFQRNSRYIL